MQFREMLSGESGEADFLDREVPFAPRAQNSDRYYVMNLWCMILFNYLPYYYLTYQAPLSFTR